MTETEALAKLKALGTAQNRKVYRRHGVGENQYGVSFGNLKKLKKEINTDHALAQQLWATGNHDAQILATMIADPTAMKAGGLNIWARDLSNYIITDAFAAFVSQTTHARKKMEQWSPSNREWLGAAGWQLMAHLAMQDSDLPDDYFEPYLRVIEHEVHCRKNRIRHTMNNALIALADHGQRFELRRIQRQ